MRTIALLLAAVATVVRSQVAAPATPCTSGTVAGTALSGNSFWCPVTNVGATGFDNPVSSCEVPAGLTLTDVTTLRPTGQVWLAKFDSASKTFVDVSEQPSDASIVSAILTADPEGGFTSDLCYQLNDGVVDEINCANAGPEHVCNAAASTIDCTSGGAQLEYHTGVLGCSLPVRAATEDGTTTDFITGDYDGAIAYETDPINLGLTTTSKTYLRLVLGGMNAAQAAAVVASASVSITGACDEAGTTVTAESVPFLGEVLTVSNPTGIPVACNMQTLSLGITHFPDFTLAVTDVPVDEAAIDGYPYNTIACARPGDAGAQALTCSRDTTLIKGGSWVPDAFVGTGAVLALGGTISTALANLDGITSTAAVGTQAAEFQASSVAVGAVSLFIIASDPATITTASIALTGGADIPETFDDVAVFLGQLTATDDAVLATPDFSTTTVSGGYTLVVGSSGMAFLVATVDFETTPIVTLTFDSQDADVTVLDTDEGSIAASDVSFTAGVDTDPGTPTGNAAVLVVTLTHPDIVDGDAGTVPAFTLGGSFRSVVATAPVVAVTAEDTATLTFNILTSVTYSAAKAQSSTASPCGSVDLELTVKFDASNDAADSTTITVLRGNPTFTVDTIANPAGFNEGAGISSGISFTISGGVDELENGCAAPAVGDITVTGDLIGEVTIARTTPTIASNAATYSFTLEGTTTREFFDLTSSTVSAGSGDFDFTMSSDITFGDGGSGSTATFTVTQTNQESAYTVIKSADVSMDERDATDFLFTIAGADILPGVASTVPAFTVGGGLDTSSIVSSSAAAPTSSSPTLGQAVVTVSAAEDAVLFHDVINEVSPGAYSDSVDIDLVLTLDDTSAATSDTITVTVANVDDAATSVTTTNPATQTENTGQAGTVLVATVVDLDFLSSFPADTCGDLLSSEATLTQGVSSPLALAATCAVSADGTAVITYTLDSNFDFEVVAAANSIVRNADPTVVVANIANTLDFDWDGEAATQATVGLVNVQELPTAGAITLTAVTATEDEVTMGQVGVVTVTITTLEHAYNFPGALQLASADAETVVAGNLENSAAITPTNVGSPTTRTIAVPAYLPLSILTGATWTSTDASIITATVPMDDFDLEAVYQGADVGYAAYPTVSEASPEFTLGLTLVQEGTDVSTTVTSTNDVVLDLVNVIEDEITISSEGGSNGIISENAVHASTPTFQRFTVAVDDVEGDDVLNGMSLDTWHASADEEAPTAFDVLTMTPAGFSDPAADAPWSEVVTISVNNADFEDVLRETSSGTPSDTEVDAAIAAGAAITIRAKVTVPTSTGTDTEFDALNDEFSGQIVFSIGNVDEHTAVSVTTAAAACDESTSSDKAESDASNDVVLTIVDEDYLTTTNAGFWSFAPTATDNLDGNDVVNGYVLDQDSTGVGSLVAGGTQRTYTVDCAAFDFEQVIAGELAAGNIADFDPESPTTPTQLDFAPGSTGSFGSPSTTLTLHDKNERPLGSGLLKTGSFEVRENSVPGTVFARLDTVDADRSVRPDPITKVTVYSLGATVEPFLIDPANWVWGLRVAEGASINLEDPEESRGSSVEPFTSEDSTFVPIVNSETFAGDAGSPDLAAARRAQEAAQFTVTTDDYTIGVGNPAVSDACDNVPGGQTSFTDDVAGQTNIFDVADVEAAADLAPHMQGQFVDEAVTEVNGLRYRQVPMCIVVWDCAGPERPQTLVNVVPACTTEAGAVTNGAKKTYFSTFLYISDRNDAPELDNTNLVPGGEEQFSDAFTLDENSPVDTEFGTVQLTDEDGDEVASVEVLPPYAGEFSVIFTGVQWRLQNLKEFDWEAPQDNVAGTNAFDINLRVTDFKPNGIPAARTVTVGITIVNLNEELFTEVSNDLTVPENTAPGSFNLGGVELKDLEGLGSFTPTDVVISDEPAGLSISAGTVAACNDDPAPNTCVSLVMSIANNAFLDFEANEEFDITLEITDDGTPSLVSTVVVTVAITDVDEDATLATSTSPASPADDVPTNSPDSEGTGWQFTVSDPEEAAVAMGDFTVTLTPPVAGAAFTVEAVSGLMNTFTLSLNARTFPDASAGAVSIAIGHTLAGSNTVTQIITFVNVEQHPTLTSGQTAATVNFVEEQLVSTFQDVVPLADPDNAFSGDGYFVQINGGTAAASVEFNGLSFAVVDSSGPELVVAPVATVAPGLDIDATSLMPTQDVTVVITDQASGTFGNGALSFTLTINVQAVDEDATATFANVVASLDEGSAADTLVADITVSDPEGVVAPSDGVTAMVDNSKFKVEWNAGAWQVLVNSGSALDFETNPSESYVVTFTGIDAGPVVASGGALAVADVQEAPTVAAPSIAAALAINVRENAVDTLLLTVPLSDIVDPDNADGSDINVVLDAQLMAATGVDSTPLFVLVPFVSGQDIELRTQPVTPLLDFETLATHEVIIRITTGVSSGDGSELTVDLPVDVQVTDVQKAPFLLVAAGGAVAGNDFAVAFDENSGINAAVDNLFFSDPDGDAVQSVEIIGPVADLFTIVPSLEGGDEFTILSLFDFNFEDEVPNTWTFAIRINERKTDGSFAFSRIATLTVNLENVNEAPTFEATTLVIPEFLAGAVTGTSVSDWAQAAVAVTGTVDLGTIQVADVDAGDMLTLTLVTPNADFEFDGFTLQYVGAALNQFNFEDSLTDLSIDVRVTDTDGLYADQTITFSVTDGNDPAALVGPVDFATDEDTVETPNTITVPSFEFFDQDAVVEADLPMFTLTVTPAAATPLFTLSQGAFASGSVELDVTYARAGDMMANAEAWSTITLTVSGGGVSHAVEVTLNDVNEAPVPDVTTVVLAESATDFDGATVHDAATITFTSQDATAAFNTFTNIVVKGTSAVSRVSTTGGEITVQYVDLNVDGGATPEPTFTLTVTKGGVDFDITLDIQATPVNEQPQLVTSIPTALPLLENSPTGTVVTEFTLSDPESLAVVSVTRDGNSWLDVQPKAGAMGTWEVFQSSGPLDFETQESSALLDLIVEVSDSGVVVGSIAVTAQLADVQEAPVLGAGSTTAFTMSETNFFNGGQLNVGSIISVVDPDTPDADAITLTVTSVAPAAPSGMDFADWFSTQKESDGVWSLHNTALTLDDAAVTPSTFTLTLTATDQTTGAADSTFEVTVTIGTMAPLLTSTPELSVDENVDITTEVGTLNIVDVDGGLVAFVTVLGQGAGVFRVSNSGGRWVMTTLAPLDRETQAEYRFPIVLVDNSVPASERTVNMVVTVNNLNELPTGANGAMTVEVVEGTADWSMPLQSDDVDAGETGVWTVQTIAPNTYVDGAADFTVTEDAEGQWTLNAAFTPDYEQHSAASTVTLWLNDDNSAPGAAALSTLVVTVQILNVNEAVTLLTPTDFSLVEDVGRLQTSLVGTAAHGISLSDADDFAGHAAVLTASVQGTDAFTLQRIGAEGEKSWEIVRAAGLDWETGPNTITFDVVVADQDPLVLPWAAPGQAVRSWTYTYTATVTNELEPTAAPTPSPTPSASASVSAAPTAAVTPSRTAVPTPTRTPAATAAVTPSSTPAVSASVGAVATVSVTPSAAATPSGTPVPGAVTRIGGSLTNIGEVTTLGSETAGSPPTALFAASSIATGAELYSQTYPGAVALAAELADGTLSSSPAQLTRVPAADAVCFVAASTQFGAEVFCYTSADRVWVAANIHPTMGSAPVILGAVGTTLWVAATGASGTNALYSVTVDPASPDTWAWHAAHSNARLLTVSTAGVYYVATNSEGDEKLYTTGGGVVSDVVTTGATALTITTMAAANSALVISGEDAAGITSLLVFIPAAGTPAAGTVTVIGQARRSLKGARALQSAFRAPRFTTTLGESVFFAWRSESDSTVDALWRVDATGAATEMAAFPAPSDAAANAVVSASALAAAGGSLFAQVSGAVGTTTTSEIYRWQAGAWTALSSVDVSAGRDVGAAPTGLKAVSANAISFSAVLGSDTSSSLVLLDVARTATAAAVIPTPSATPSASPAAAAQAAQPEPEDEDNSAALGAGIAIVVILMVAALAFVAWRACAVKKEPEAVPAATAAAPASAEPEAAPEAAAQV